MGGNVAWDRGDGPLVAFADGYRCWLEQRGLSGRSVKGYLLLAGQLNRWAVSEGLTAAELTWSRAEQFLADRRAAGWRRVPTMRVVSPLVTYLQDRGVVPVEPTAVVSPVEVLLVDYGHYLGHDRGLAPLTVLRYQRMARRFLFSRSARAGAGTGVEGLDSVEVNAYLLESCSRLVVGSAKREAADLRSLLRFLFSRSLTATDLGAAMPPVAGWRDTRLPATMTSAQVTALLDSCDRSQPAGLRDFAILSLLGRLGLRSGEVAALRLGDINWRAGEILIRGKGRRVDWLPLTVDAGEALAGYLRSGRPSVACPNVILTSYAPFRGIHPSSITRVVYRACARAGLSQVGGHRLRHALATEMLRQGGDLVEIGQVLRHRDLASTSVYAKLDRVALRSVAQPWPGAVR